MVTVNFGTINSSEDLGLFLHNSKISTAVPKRYTTSVPGRSGDLEFTHALTGDDIAFENRTMTLAFVRADYQREWDAIFSEIFNKIHGRRFHVVFDSDPQWYWDAFCTVEEPSAGNNRIDCIIRGDLYPFKRKDIVIEAAIPAAGRVFVRRDQGRETVYPTITTDAAVTVQVNGQTVSLSAGTHKNPAIYFTEETSEYRITGAANVTISYSEGSL